MWAAPVLDARAAHVLASDLQEGTWRLRAYPLNAAIIGGSARGRGFALGSEPDTSLSFSFYEKGPLVVAGRIGDGPEPAAAAWTLGDLDERAGGRAGRRLAPGPPGSLPDRADLGGRGPRLRPDLGGRSRGRAARRVGGAPAALPRPGEVGGGRDAPPRARARVVRGERRSVGRARGGGARATSRSSSPRPPVATGSAGTTAASGRRSPHPTAALEAACAERGRVHVLLGALGVVGGRPDGRLTTPAYGRCAPWQDHLRRCSWTRSWRVLRRRWRTSRDGAHAGGGRVRAVWRAVGADRCGAGGRGGRPGGGVEQLRCRRVGPGPAADDASGCGG